MSEQTTQNTDLFGAVIIKDELLREKFIAPLLSQPVPRATLVEKGVMSFPVVEVDDIYFPFGIVFGVE